MIQTEKVKFRYIKQEYGEQVFKNIRRYEKLSKIQGRYTSHLRFCLQCKHCDIIPKSVKISSQLKNREARRVIHRAEIQLLNTRITEIVQKKRSIEENKEILKQELERDLPKAIYEQIEEKMKEVREEELRKCSIRQKKKYMKLRYGEQMGQRRFIEAKETKRRKVWYNQGLLESQIHQEDREEQKYGDNNEEEIHGMMMEREERINREEEDEADEEDGHLNWQMIQRRNEEINKEVNQLQLSQMEAGQENRIEQERNAGLQRRISMRRKESSSEVETREINKAIAAEDDSNVKERWVLNLSERNLTNAERNVLSKGGGYAIVPNKIPYDDYIVATEIACRNLSKGQAAALRGEVTEILCQAKTPKSNLKKEERIALESLKKDDKIVIVPADKGKCLVVMNRKDYIEKMEIKLKDITTYRSIDKDPTLEIKESLTRQLKMIRDKGEIDQKEYLKLVPSQTQIPRMYGQPKIHKEGYPLREIVDASGGVTKHIDKYISRIIKTYVGDNEFSVKNSADFVTKIEGLKVEKNEMLVSYDVKALYPSIPQEEAITLIHELLNKDKELEKKTKMSAESVINLFKTCVQKTYFVFNKELYIQINGLAIGASTSGFAAEIFMSRYEKNALSLFVDPPSIWIRYVDDTFTKMKSRSVDAFLEHLNNQHERIKFTREKQEDNKIAFLDTLIHIKEDGGTKITIYRKETHTDQYLDFQSNHHIKQKMGLVSTFKNRIKVLVTEEEDKIEEEKYVKKALRRCGHPNWVLERNQKRRKKEEKIEPYARITIPYIKKTSERLAMMFRKHNIEVCHKPTNTIKSVVCNKMKDAVHKLDKTGAVYHIRCKKHDQDYIGETERVLRARLYEHKLVDHKTAVNSQSICKEEVVEEERLSRRSSRKKDKIDYKDLSNGNSIIMSEGNTEVSSHMASEEHGKEDIEYSIIRREQNWWKRGIREAIAIKEKQPNLNADDGRYHLSPIYSLVFEAKKSNGSVRKDVKSVDNGQYISNTEEGS